jgi:TonB family protein
MPLLPDTLHFCSIAGAPSRRVTAICCGVLALAIGLGLSAQEPAPAPSPDAQQPAAPAPDAAKTADAAQQPAAPSPAPDAAPPKAAAPDQTPDAKQPPAPGTDAVQQPAAAPQPAAPQETPQPAPSAGNPPAPQIPAPAPAPSAAPAHPPVESIEPPEAGGITEEELKQLLVGKALYLRGGYLENSLSFDEDGRLIGHSPQGSYTLSGLQIDRVRLTKHKVELEGARYGLHFLGQLAYEDATSAVDRVKITPKKKIVKITIDREIVVKPKKQKDASKGKKKSRKGEDTAVAEPAELSEADQLKASIAAAPEAERPADASRVTTTTSPAHAAKTLRNALDLIFAPGLDERMMAAMPDFWKLYYQAAAAKTDYRPKDPAVLRQNTVDKKAKLVSTFEPPSNEFAQANGVAGMALYHTVIGPDGKPGEIAVGRPIGFGLDENAVDAIRKASFEPAIKDGKAVPVLLDLVVQFRIYSKRTSVVGKPEDPTKPAESQLPGPYTVQHMPAKP